MTATAYDLTKAVFHLEQAQDNLRDALEQGTELTANQYASLLRVVAHVSTETHMARNVLKGLK